MRHTDPNEARAASEAAIGLRQLNERSREIFKRIVETYLATGEPVGSRNLSRARSEEHTSELQSLMRISYAVFCLKKKTSNKRADQQHPQTTTRSNQIQHTINK